VRDLRHAFVNRPPIRRHHSPYAGRKVQLDGPLPALLHTSLLPRMPAVATSRGHHVFQSAARCNPVKALRAPRYAPPPSGADGLDRLAVEPRAGFYVMPAGFYPVRERVHPIHV
jgi:hypothetical protein